MSHTAPPSPGRRRWEYVAGIAAVAFGIALTVVAIVALNHPHGRSAGTPGTSGSNSASPSASRSTSHSPAASGSATSPPKAQGNTGRPVLGPAVEVVVVNNSNDSALAEVAVGRLRVAGWRASDGGNFSGDILSTAVYYDPTASGAQAEARRLHTRFPAIKRVRPRFDALPAGAVVLVVTSDYS
jgi:hypothetical protein